MPLVLVLCGGCALRVGASSDKAWCFCCNDRRAAVAHRVLGCGPKESVLGFAGNGSMKTKPAKPRTIDEYIAGFPDDIQDRLQKIRMTIRKAAPQAEEKISYQIPTFALNGNLVHFAAFKNHIGFFPTSSGIREFKKELSIYKCSKGTAQFPLDKPIPLGLISRIVKFRVKENLARAAAAKRAKLPS